MKDQSQKWNVEHLQELCRYKMMWWVEEAKDRIDASRFFRYQVNKADLEFLEKEFSLPSSYEII